MSILEELHSAHKERMKRLNPPSPPLKTRRKRFSFIPFRGFGGCWVAARPIFWWDRNTLIPRAIQNRLHVIRDFVCRETFSDVVDIHSKRRDAPTVLIRQCIMYLCKTKTTHSLPEIGRMLGGRDHTTILHGVRKIEALRAADPVLNATLTNYEEKIDVLLDRYIAKDLVSA